MWAGYYSERADGSSANTAVKPQSVHALAASRVPDSFDILEQPWPMVTLWSPAARLVEVSFTAHRVQAQERALPVSHGAAARGNASERCGVGCEGGARPAGDGVGMAKTGNVEVEFSQVPDRLIDIWRRPIEPATLDPSALM